MVRLCYINNKVLFGVKRPLFCQNHHEHSNVFSSTYLVRSYLFKVILIVLDFSYLWHEYFKFKYQHLYWCMIYLGFQRSFLLSTGPQKEIAHFRGQK